MPDVFIVWQTKTTASALGPFDSARQCREVLAGDWGPSGVPKRAEKAIVRGAKTIQEAIDRVLALQADCQVEDCNGKGSLPSSAKYRVSREIWARDPGDEALVCASCARKFAPRDKVEPLRKGITILVPGRD